MKTLVTGGAGFIGSNLVQLLLKEGHDVTVLDNLSSGYRVNLRPFPEAQLIVGDVRDVSIVDRAMNAVEVIFHLVASVPMGFSQKMCFLASTAASKCIGRYPGLAASITISTSLEIGRAHV